MRSSSIVVVADAWLGAGGGAPLRGSEPAAIRDASFHVAAGSAGFAGATAVRGSPSGAIAAR